MQFFLFRRLIIAWKENSFEAVAPSVHQQIIANVFVFRFFCTLSLLRNFQVQPFLLSIVATSFPRTACMSLDWAIFKIEIHLRRLFKFKTRQVENDAVEKQRYVSCLISISIVIKNLLFLKIDASIGFAKRLVDA